MAVTSCPLPTPAVPADPMFAPATVMSVLLFDDAGNIAHGHQEAFLPGAAQVLPAQVEANARRAFLAQNPNKPSALNALHLAGALADNLCAGVSYKVINCKLVKG